MVKLNIQIPRCCDDCFALDEYGDYPTCRITHTSRGYNFNVRAKRMPDCPLIEEESETLKQIALTGEQRFQGIKNIMHEIAHFAAPQQAANVKGECDNATN